MTFIQEKPRNKGKKENHRANINKVVPIMSKSCIKEEAMTKPKMPPLPSGIHSIRK